MSEREAKRNFIVSRESITSNGCVRLRSYRPGSSPSSYESYDFEEYDQNGSKTGINYYNLYYNIFLYMCAIKYLRISGDGESSA